MASAFDAPKFQMRAPYIKGQSQIHMLSVGVNPVPPPKYGGIEAVVANLCAGLTALGHRIVLYAPGDCPIAGIRHVRTMPEAVKSYADNGLIIVNPAAHLAAMSDNLADLYQPGDIIHLHQLLLARQLPGLTDTAANLCETAHWTEVGLDHNIFYPSKALEAEMGLPGTLVYHGIDVDHWRPDETAAPEAGRFLFAGRLTEDKGVDTAAAACKRFGTTLVVAGPQPDAANRFGHALMADIDYVGELDPSGLRHEYSRATAMIYLTQYCEPFGLAVVEAMACGCPVIVSGNGATSETVLHGETGYIVRDEAELMQAMRDVGTLDRGAAVRRAQAFSLARQMAAQEAAYARFFS